MVQLHHNLAHKLQLYLSVEEVEEVEIIVLLALVMLVKKVVVV